MQTTHPQTTITRFDFNDKMNFIADKLKFLSLSINCWDDDKADLDGDLRMGFSFIMDDLIEEMQLCIENLEK